jgi:hypothetical protein
MKVKVVGRITLADDVSTFYELKKLGQCPLCNSGIQATTENRTLKTQCSPGCKNNVSIPIPRVITYDRKVEEAKSELDEATSKVLKAKFDFLFQYSKEKSLEDLKLNYITARQQYNDVTSIYNNITRLPDVRGEMKILQESSGRAEKKRDWCPRYLRFAETEARVQHLKYKGANEVCDMMPYTWAELETRIKV